MPQALFQFYTVPIAQYMRDQIIAALGTQLGIKWYQTGDEESVPIDSISANLNALFIAYNEAEFQIGDVFTPTQKRLVAHHYQIRLYQKQIDGNIPDEDLRPALDKIAALFLNAEFQLPGLESNVGMEVRWCIPTRIDRDRAAESAFLNTPENRVSIGFVDIVAVIQMVRTSTT